MAPEDPEADDSVAQPGAATPLPIGLAELLGGAVEAKGELLTRLMQQTARVPFDDRRAFEASNEDLRVSLAREFLHDVGSELVREPDVERVYAQMQLTRRQNGHTVPRNVALLFFSDDPRRWFRGAQLEVVEFGDDAGGDTIDEKIFKGPLPHQLRQCLSWLQSMTVRHLHKQADQARALTWASYPFPALREAVVNAVYHRSYQDDAVEPTKVYLFPNRVEITSYPGPVDGIEQAHLLGTEPLPPVPARNRRIGELLKELKLAEARGTGLPKIRRTMAENGSPAASFDFDAQRSYFRVTLPAHPQYVALTQLRDYAYRQAIGDDEGALRVLERELLGRPPSPATAVALGEARGQPTAPQPDWGQLLIMMNLHLAMLAFLSRSYQQAHQLFLQGKPLLDRRTDASLAFAQTKLALADEPEVEPVARQRLLGEALELLERLLQRDATTALAADAWFELANARRSLQRPPSEITDALEHALALRPSEQRFVDALAAVRASAS